MPDVARPTTKLEWALNAAKLGYRVFPCVPGGRTPLPLKLTLPFRRTLADKIEDWWSTVPDANIGAHLGRPDDDKDSAAITVLCIDPSRGASADDLEIQYGRLLHSRVSQAPNGVVHVHMLGEVPSRLEFPGAGYDLRSNDDYILLPGSRVAEGEYTWKHLKRARRGYAIEPMPDWLRKDGGRSIDAEPEPEWDAPAKVIRAIQFLYQDRSRQLTPRQARDETIRAAETLLRRGISKEMAAALMRAYYHMEISWPSTKDIFAPPPFDPIGEAVEKTYGDEPRERAPQSHSTR